MALTLFPSMLLQPARASRVTLCRTRHSKQAFLAASTQARKRNIRQRLLVCVIQAAFDLVQSLTTKPRWRIAAGQPIQSLNRSPSRVVQCYISRERMRCAQDTREFVMRAKKEGAWAEERAKITKWKLQRKDV